MSPEDQELLSAYLDNELDQAKRQSVQSRLLAEPEFNAALQQLQRLQKSVQHAFPEQQDLPVPEGIKQLLRDTAVAPDKNANVAPIKKNKVTWMLPIAASVAAVFIATSFMFSQNNTSADPWPQVAQRLDNAKDMKITEINNDLSLVVLQSFTHIDGRRCREYQRKDEQQVVHAIACKTPDTWKREVIVEADLDLQDYQTATKTPNKIKAFLTTFKR